jgi:hypothetical protein
MADVECDDADPCTIDRCVAGGCGAEQRTGFDGVLCAFERELDGPSCSGAPVPGALGKQFDKARSLVLSAREAAPSKRAGKLLAKAGGKLTKGLRMVPRAARRRCDPLAATCADALMHVVGDARSRVQTMQVSDDWELDAVRTSSGVCTDRQTSGTDREVVCVSLWSSSCSSLRRRWQPSSHAGKGTTDRSPKRSPASAPWSIHAESRASC